MYQNVSDKTRDLLVQCMRLHSAFRALWWNPWGMAQAPEHRTSLCCWQGSAGPGASWG